MDYQTDHQVVQWITRVFPPSGLARITRNYAGLLGLLRFTSGYFGLPSITKWSSGFPGFFPFAIIADYWDYADLLGLHQISSIYFGLLRFAADYFGLPRITPDYRGLPDGSPSGPVDYQSVSTRRITSNCSYYSASLRLLRIIRITSRISKWSSG